MKNASHTGTGKAGNDVRVAGAVDIADVALVVARIPLGEDDGVESAVWRGE